MIIFRDLEKKDASQVALLIPQLTQNIIEPENLSVRIEHINNHPNCKYLVAELDGKIIGFAGLAWYPIPSKGLIGWIEEVVVDSQYRGNGIAYVLMESLIKLAEQKGIKQIKLTTGTTSAKHLYEKFGFVKKDQDYFVKKL